MLPYITLTFHSAAQPTHAVTGPRGRLRIGMATLEHSVYIVTPKTLGYLVMHYLNFLIA
jgi:hypothetical protein